MVVTVPWADYSPEQVERLVSAWLVRTVPGAHRVDGAGGDDGADVRVSVDRGLHVFEIKSFHRRLTRANKSQILRSLATAVKHQTTMFRWTLVLPLDLSPAEIRWFEQTVASTASILIDWIGRTEIESGLSQHQDLLRSLAPGSVERRALDLAAEYNRAVWAVPHIPAAIEVGQGEGDMQAEFQAAHAAAGGIASLGRPVDEVFRFGPGYAQSFPEAANPGPAVMCALPDHAAIVVPAEIWRALNRLGGGAERNGGVSAGGFPVGPLGVDGSPVIPSSATVVELAGGDWVPGRLVCKAPGSWSWQAIPRVDHLMHHNTRWTGNEGADLQIRAVLDLPWLPSPMQPEVTKTRRVALQNALSDTEFMRVLSELSVRRGASLPAPTWAPATGNDSYHSDRGTHIRAHVLAPDGSPALSGDVILYLDNATSLVGCVRLLIKFAAWRAALAAEGAELSAAPDLRLSLFETIEVLASAWGTATSRLPGGVVDDPSRMALARPPYVEMHLRSAAPFVSETRRSLGLSDVIDLSALGQPTRTDGIRQETGLRVFAPLDADRAVRKTLIAQGLAILGRAWGYIDADADDLLLNDHAPTSPHG